MKFKRIEDAYHSIDGRVVIRKVISQQTGRPTEKLWELTIDDETKVMCWDTKKEAIREAERLLNKVD